MSHLIPKGSLNKSSSMDALNSILAKYPQCMVIAGHDHNTIYDEMNINQTDFTVVNPGSVHFSDFYRVDSYIENSKGNEIIFKNGYSSYDLPTALMLYVDIHGNIKIERLDFKHANVLINDPWYLEKPKADKSHLNNYRFDRKDNNQNPTWPNEKDLLAEYDTTNSKIVISFNRPFDNDGFIYEYQINFLDSTKQIVSTKYTLSDFWLTPNTLDMPKTFKIEIPNIINKPDYIELIGVDDLRGETIPIQTRVR